MAGMMQREEVALRKAERALVVAEEYVEVTPGPFDEMSPGHYLPEDEVDVSVTDWSDIVRKVKSEEIPDLSAEDAFIVEYQGEVTLPGSALNDGGDTIPGDKVNVYRITTRSETEGKAVRIVESNYTKLYNPMEP
jgi:hypothetical protein